MIKKNKGKLPIQKDDTLVVQFKNLKTNMEKTKVVEKMENERVLSLAKKLIKVSGNIEQSDFSVMERHLFSSVLAKISNIETKKSTIIHFLRNPQFSRWIFAKKNNCMYMRKYSITNEKCLNISVEENSEWEMLNEDLLRDIFYEFNILLSFLPWVYKHFTSFFNDCEIKYENMINRIHSRFGDFFYAEKRLIGFFNKTKKMIETIKIPSKFFQYPILSRGEIFTDKVDDKKYHNIIEQIFGNWANNDQELKMVLFQMIGKFLMHKNTLGSVMIMYGDGGNGKSTFQDLVNELLGDDFYMKANLAHLDEDSFEAIHTFRGVRGAGFDDISEGEIPKPAILFLKQATDYNNHLTLKVKHQRSQLAYVAQNYIFASNFEKNISENNEAIHRRFFWIPFTKNNTRMGKNFSRSHLKTLFQDTEFKKVVRSLAIKAYFKNECEIHETSQMKLIKREFTKPRIVSFIEDWKDGITVKSWNDESYFEMEENREYTSPEIYELYFNWASQNGYRSLGRNKFLREFERNCASFYIFCKILEKTKRSWIWKNPLTNETL